MRHGQAPSLMSRESPVSELKKWVCVSSSRAQTTSPTLRTNPLAVRARSNWWPMLQIDDVVGAKWLDDMRLDRDMAGRLLARHHHAFRTHADGQIRLGIFRRHDARMQLGGKAERAVAIAELRRVASPSTSTRALMMFMTGLPMNWATKRFAGLR